MNQKSLRTFILFLAVCGLFLTADVFAADITFSGRTFVDGVQVSGVKVIIHARFMPEPVREFHIRRVTAAHDRFFA